MHYDEFLSLNVERVAKLIQSDRLTVASEEQVRQLYFFGVHSALIKFEVIIKCYWVE